LLCGRKLCVWVRAWVWVLSQYVYMCVYLCLSLYVCMCVCACASVRVCRGKGLIGYTHRCTKTHAVFFLICYLAYIVFNNRLWSRWKTENRYRHERRTLSYYTYIILYVIGTRDFTSRTIRGWSNRRPNRCFDPLGNAVVL